MKYKLSFSITDIGELYMVHPDTFKDRIGMADVLLISKLRQDYDKNMNEDPEENDIKVLRAFGEFIFNLRYQLKNSLIYLCQKDYSYSDYLHLLKFKSLPDLASKEQVIDYFLSNEDFHIIISDTVLSDEDNMFDIYLIENSISDRRTMSIDYYDRNHYTTYDIDS